MKTEVENKANSSLIESMFEAGAHFGYSKLRRHPSFKIILFGSKNGTDIINLEKTGYYLAQATEFVKKAASDGKNFLFVGTKPEARGVVAETAISLDIPYVSHRWIGGTLTNFSEIKKRVSLFEKLQDQKEKGEFSVYTKKEQLGLEKQISDLSRNFGGITTMEKLPDIIFLVDSKHEDAAIKEAKIKNIPVVALAGSDCNLNDVEYPIPANDSAVSSINFFVKQIAQAYTDGKKEGVLKKEEKSRAEEKK